MFVQPVVLDSVRSTQDDVLIDGATEMIPTVPTHGRGSSEAVVQRVCSWQIAQRVRQYPDQQKTRNGRHGG